MTTMTTMTKLWFPYRIYGYYGHYRIYQGLLMYKSASSDKQQQTISVIRQNQTNSIRPTVAFRHSVKVWDS